MNLFKEHELKALEGYTDLEKKLFEYIVFLIGLTNVYSLTLQYIQDSMKSIAKWEMENLDSFDAIGEYPKMLEELNKEFKWNFNNHKKEE
jgi:hypothetical protein